MVLRVYMFSVPVAHGNIAVELRANNDGVGWAADWLTEEQGFLCGKIMSGLTERGMISSFCFANNLEQLGASFEKFCIETGIAVSDYSAVMAVLFAVRKEVIARDLVKIG